MAKTYEAMQKVVEKPSNSWRFLDLRNRKQTGDLEKKILQYKQKNGFKIFNFSSAREKEGVSTILTNLVNYFKFQNSDHKILLIDANFKSPALHKVFNIHNGQGLSDILANEQDLEESCIPIESTNITLLPCGQRFASQTDNLNQEKFMTVLNGCKDHYNTILIDSAPIITSPNALSIALSSDVTFLVIQSLKVQREVALKMKLLLQDNECIIGGVILNKVLQVIPNWIYRAI